MKFFLVFILAFFLGVSCNKDIYDSSEKSHLRPVQLSQKIKNMIPNEYRHSKYVIFKDDNGNYKNLTISIHEGIQTRFLGEKPYEAETLDFLLRDSTDNSYMISVGAYVGYSQLKQPFNYLNISLFNTINNGKIVFIEIPEERSPLLLGSFHTSKYLLDKSFTDVYEGFKFSDMSSFSDLFYTIKEGVVGFRDKNNKLWVLERFE